MALSRLHPALWVCGPVSGDCVTEQTLAAQCVAGDDRAQRQFIDEHIDYIHRILFRILGRNNDVVEDLVQDALIQVLQSLRTFRGEATLRTWIARITVRVAYAHLKRGRVQTVPLELHPDISGVGPGAEAQLAARSAGRRMYALLDEIDPKQRIAFVLHAIDGRTAREVAQMTGSNLIATKSRIRRTKSKLREDSVVSAFLREAGI